MRHVSRAAPDMGLAASLIKGTSLLSCDLDIMCADPHAGGYGVVRQALHGPRLPATGVSQSIA